jgi:hypothetical protein
MDCRAFSGEEDIDLAKRYIRKGSYGARGLSLMAGYRLSQGSNNKKGLLAICHG